MVGPGAPTGDRLPAVSFRAAIVFNWRSKKASVGSWLGRGSSLFLEVPFLFLRGGGTLDLSQGHFLSPKA